MEKQRGLSFCTRFVSALNTLTLICMFMCMYIFNPNHFSVYHIVVVQLLSRVQLFVTPWTAAHQASLSSTISWSLLSFMSTESEIPSNHLIPLTPFSSCPQPFPASGSFPMSWLFTSVGQRIGASAIVLPVSIQG